MDEEGRKRLLVMMQHIPRWTDNVGRIISPNEVLLTAADLLVVLSDALDDDDEKAKKAIGGTASFLRLIASASTEQQIPRVADA